MEWLTIYGCNARTRVAVPTHLKDPHDINNHFVDYLSDRHHDSTELLNSYSDTVHVKLLLLPCTESKLKLRFPYTTPYSIINPCLPEIDFPLLGKQYLCQKLKLH